MQLQSSILGRLDSELPGAICRELGNPRAHLQQSVIGQIDQLLRANTNRMSGPLSLPKTLSI